MISLTTLLVLVLQSPIRMNFQAVPQYDYCTALPEDESKNKFMADSTKAKSDPVNLPRPAKTLKPGQIPERMNIFGETDRNKSYFRIAIVPVGYEAHEVDKKMMEFIKILQAGFSGMENVSFSYVYPSYQLEFEKVDQLVAPKNWEQTMKFQTSFGPYSDAIILALNYPGYLGTTYFVNSIDANRGLAIIGTMYPQYSPIHEAGHIFGVDDGYTRYYGKDSIPNTELFYGIDSLPSIVARAYKRLPKPPALVPAGTCAGKPVYRFDGSEKSIMTACIGCETFKKYFSDIQIMIMEEFAENLKNIQKKGRR